MFPDASIDRRLQSTRGAWTDVPDRRALHQHLSGSTPLRLPVDKATEFGCMGWTRLTVRKDAAMLCCLKKEGGRVGNRIHEIQHSNRRETDRPRYFAVPGLLESYEMPGHWRSRALPISSRRRSGIDVPRWSNRTRTADKDLQNVWPDSYRVGFARRSRMLLCLREVLYI